MARMRRFVRALIAPTRLGQWVIVIRAVRFHCRHTTGRAPGLLRPRRFSDKMQWRKLFELDPIFAVLSDKLAVRDFVAQRVGPGRQPDLLWVGENADDIPFDRLVPPYALKSTHASGQSLIVEDAAALDVAAARAAARGWLATCHGTGMHEPGYIHVPRRLIVERLVRRPDGQRPLERKFYVYDGRAVFVRTNTADGTGHHNRFGDIHSRDWTWLPIRWGSPAHPVPPPRPRRLAEMIDMAERIGAGLTHCRVDLYDRDEEAPVVGEITLYSQSGLANYADPADDFTLGAPWIIRRPMLRACWAVAFGRWEIRPPG
jgi:hypothetical protein